MNNRFVEFVMTVLLLAGFGSLQAGDSPRFRGLNGSGTSAETGLPSTWSAQENIAWRALLTGYGASSPVTFGNKIYLTTYSGYGTAELEAGDQSELQLHVICLDRADGSPLWDQSIAGNRDERNYQGFVALHGYASGTPALDESGVYAFFGSSGVVAYDHRGTLLWKADVGSGTHNFGTGASPVLYDGLLIVNASVESDSLIALDKQTGKEVWRTEDVSRAWNTPVLVVVENGTRELVLNVQGKLQGFSPTTGERLWTYDSGTSDYICPSPVTAGGVVYAICGRRGPVVAVRAGGRGDVTESHAVWRAKGTSNVPSPVLSGDHLYFISDNGIAYCLAAESGEVVYKERLRDTGRVYASLLAADGKLYAVSRERGTYVLAATPEFQQLGLNEIADDESIFNASPVVSRGQLLLRSDRYLYCIGK